MEQPNFPGTNTLETYSFHHMEEFTETMHRLADDMETFCKKNGYKYEFKIPGWFFLSEHNRSILVCNAVSTVVLDNVAEPIDIIVTVKMVAGLRNGFLLDYDALMVNTLNDFMSDNTIDMIDDVCQTQDKEAMQDTLNHAFNTLTDGIE